MVPLKGSVVGRALMADCYSAYMPSIDDVGHQLQVTHTPASPPRPQLCGGQWLSAASVARRDRSLRPAASSSSFTTTCHHTPSHTSAHHRTPSHTTCRCLPPRPPIVRVPSPPPPQIEYTPRAVHSPPVGTPGSALHGDAWNTYTRRSRCAVTANSDVETQVEVALTKGAAEFLVVSRIGAGGGKMNDSWCELRISAHRTPLHAATS